MTYRKLALKAAVLTAATLWIGGSAAAPLPLPYVPGAMVAPMVPSLPLDEVAPDLRRQLVNYPAHYAAGTVVIDTAQTQLYYVLGNGKAIRYGIGVGRDGFRWSGTETVTRKAEWPDWTPPAEMILRQPYLARWMAGGEGNPLGARAIYLGNTVYRIHGTNNPDTIGERVSSGCIRMLNADVVDLYDRINVGTKIVVLPGRGYIAAIDTPSPRRTAPAIY